VKQLTLVLIFLLTVFYFVQRQSKENTLKLQEQSTPLEADSSRSISLSKSAWMLRRDAPREEVDSLVCLAVSLAIWEDNDFNHCIGLAKKVLGYLENLDGNIEALELYEEAIIALEKSKDFEEVAAVYLLHGNFLLRTGRTGEAAESYYAGSRFADHCKNQEVKASIFTMIAEVKVRQEEYESAMTYFQNAISIQEKMNAPKRLATTYYSFGNLYARIDTLDRARFYYDEAEAIFEREGAVLQQSLVLGARGNLQLKQKKLEAALDYYNQSL